MLPEVGATPPSFASTICGLLPIVPSVPLVLAKLTVEPVLRIKSLRVRTALLRPAVLLVTLSAVAFPAGRYPRPTTRPHSASTSP